MYYRFYFESSTLFEDCIAGACVLLNLRVCELSTNTVCSSVLTGKMSSDSKHLTLDSA